MAKGRVCLHLLSYHSFFSSAFIVTFPEHKCTFASGLRDLHICTKSFLTSKKLLK